jgi:hypothetical protein
MTQKAPPYELIGFLIALCLQAALWTRFKTERPDFVIVPEPPSLRSVEAYSLGDAEFYFRVASFNLQNAGDTFGRFTALKEYSYAKLYDWFMLMDALDRRSDAVPTMAGYYYSQTQNVPDVQYVVDYLVGHVDRNPDLISRKWIWLTQAVYLANHRLNDTAQALKIAYKLRDLPTTDIPMWAKQMPAFIEERLGDYEEAYRIMDAVFEEYKGKKDISEGELNFLRHFLDERIKRPQEKGGLSEKIEEYREKRAF